MSAIHVGARAHAHARARMHARMQAHTCGREKVNRIIVLTLFREFLNEAWDFVTAGEVEVRSSVYCEAQSHRLSGR